MEIISVVPRGYCQGVVRAIQIARQTARENRGTKVTMLGMIVHNQYVVDACRKEGIEFVEDPGKTREELLDEIDEGIVIFTAHGISPSVRHKAVSKGLQVVDASCRDVIRTHQLVTSAIEDGMDVLYIGKKVIPNQKVPLAFHSAYILSHVWKMSKNIRIWTVFSSPIRRRFLSMIRHRS